MTKAFGPVRPDLNEARLVQMQARASRIYQGVSAGNVNVAEDVLLLVAEVRHLRAELAATKSVPPKTEEDLFRGMNNSFESVFGDLFPKRPEYESKPSLSDRLKNRWKKHADSTSEGPSTGSS